jgi:uncharacterized protein YdhG (YjbR/CyaY superfamily)
MKAAAASSVDGYLADLPKDVRAVLEKLRKTIKAAAPDAEEGISYQMPAYKYHGQLVYFAAFKDHCSFFPGSKSIVEMFAEELEPFEASAGTIHFTVDHPLPQILVKKIVKMRMRQNEERKKSK